MGPKKRKNEQDSASPDSAAQPTPDLSKSGNDEPPAQRRRIEYSSSSSSSGSLVLTKEQFIERLNQAFKELIPEAGPQFEQLVIDTPDELLRKEVLSNPLTPESCKFQVLLIQTLLATHNCKQTALHPKLKEFARDVVLTTACLQPLAVSLELSTRADQPGSFSMWALRDPLIFKDIPHLFFCNGVFKVLSELCLDHWQWLRFFRRVRDSIPFRTEFTSQRERVVRQFLDNIPEQKTRDLQAKQIDDRFFGFDSVGSILRYNRAYQFNTITDVLKVASRFLIRGHPAGPRAISELYFLLLQTESGYSREKARQIGALLPNIFMENSALSGLSALEGGIAKYALLGCSGMLSTAEFGDHKTHGVHTKERHVTLYEEKIVKPASDLFQQAPKLLIGLNFPAVLARMVLEYFGPSEFVIRRDLARDLNLCELLFFD